MNRRRSIPSNTIKRIWGESGFRLFLSHRSGVKKRTAALKDALHLFGVSAFVAHTDIEPSQEWQNEIEDALHTMHAFAALMTENFHESDWTDQEVGFAFGRGVPIVAVNLGRNPYGFIGKFQALPCTWATAPQELVQVLLKHVRMRDEYISAVKRCPNWDAGNRLAEALPAISRLSDEQANRLVAIYNTEGEVNGSFGFNGSKPNRCGEGLLFHLRRANGRQYKELPSNRIKVITPKPPSKPFSKRPEHSAIP